MNARLGALLVICAGVLLLTAWTPNAASPTIPRCTARDTQLNTTHSVSAYIRFCGAARGIVYLNDESYAVRGGHCDPVESPRNKRRLLTDITIGWLSEPPAAPGQGIWLPHLQATRPGPVQLNDSEIEVAGTRVAASGTVLVGAGLRSGSFFLYGRDASGPTGVTLAGTW